MKSTLWCRPIILMAAAIFLFTVPQRVARAEEINFDNLSLEDLLNIKTAVTTRTEMTPRSSPGSVTVITANEISNAGARDLMDILQLIPGIGFGNDS